MCRRTIAVIGRVSLLVGIALALLGCGGPVSLERDEGDPALVGIPSTLANVQHAADRAQAEIAGAMVRTV